MNVYMELDSVSVYCSWLLQVHQRRHMVLKDNIYQKSTQKAAQLISYAWFQ